MKRCYVVLLVLLAIGVSAQASLVVNGDFQMYKPGDPTVTAEFDLTSGNPYVTVEKGVETLTLKSGLVTYSDGSDGGIADTVVLPGWVDSSDEGKNQCNLVPNGPGSTTALNAFGGWGSPGSKVRSESSLGTIGADVDYLLSAMVNANDTGTRILRLLANGVEVAPSSAVDPADNTGWGEISRTYAAGDIVGLVGQSLMVELGCTLPVSGSATQFQSVTLVPEPATMLLLGLGGLALIRRKK